MLPRFYCWTIHYGVDVNSNSHFMKVRLRAYYTFPVLLRMAFVDLFEVICCFPHCDILSNPDNIKIIYVKEQHNLTSKCISSFPVLHLYFYWLLCPYWNSFGSNGLEQWISTLGASKITWGLKIYIKYTVNKMDIQALPAKT